MTLKEPPNIEIALFDAGQLLDPHNTQLVTNMNNVINEAYVYSHKSQEQFFKSRRVVSQDQLSQELGHDGLIAVALDKSLVDDGDEAWRRYGQVVACAAVKPWKGPVVQNWLATQQQSIAKPVVNAGEWEVAVCATRSGPMYRGAGVVSRCVEAVTRTVFQKQPDAKSIKFWASALEGSGSSEYWVRRGFTLHSTDVAPRGVWASEGDFEISTLCKTICIQ